MTTLCLQIGHQKKNYLFKDTLQVALHSLTSGDGFKAHCSNTVLDDEKWCSNHIGQFTLSGAVKGQGDYLGFAQTIYF